MFLQRPTLPQLQHTAARTILGAFLCVFENICNSNSSDSASQLTFFFFVFRNPPETPGDWFTTRTNTYPLQGTQYPPATNSGTENTNTREHTHTHRHRHRHTHTHAGTHLPRSRLSALFSSLSLPPPPSLLSLSSLSLSLRALSSWRSFSRLASRSASLASASCRSRSRHSAS